MAIRLVGCSCLAFLSLAALYTQTEYDESTANQRVTLPSSSSCAIILRAIPRITQYEAFLRALITGISGFVGSHLAEYLLAHTDWQVAGTVYGQVDNIATSVIACCSIPRSSRGWRSSASSSKRASRIPSFTWPRSRSSRLSRQDPWFTLENNIRAQLNILEAVVQLRLASRVLVVGSAENTDDAAAADLPIDEETPLAPGEPLRGQQSRAGLPGPAVLSEQRRAERCASVHSITSGRANAKALSPPISRRKSRRSRWVGGRPRMKWVRSTWRDDFSETCATSSAVITWP